MLYCVPREEDGALTIPFPSFEMDGQGSRALAMPVASSGREWQGQGPVLYSVQREQDGGPDHTVYLHSEWKGTGQGPSLYALPRDAGGA